jgi:hypothetical protein
MAFSQPGSGVRTAEKHPEQYPLRRLLNRTALRVGRAPSHSMLNQYARQARIQTATVSMSP